MYINAYISAVQSRFLRDPQTPLTSEVQCVRLESAH